MDMRNLSSMKQILWVFLASLFLLNVQTIFADSADEKEQKKKIPLKGTWAEDKRSLEIDYPVSVYWDGVYLYVESSSSRSEIQVTVSNGTEILCEETLPVGSCPATVYVGALEPEGVYEVVLTNQFGDRLEGWIE